MQLCDLLQLVFSVKFVANFAAELWSAQCPDSALHASCSRMFTAETQHRGVH